MLHSDKKELVAVRERITSLLAEAHVGKGYKVAGLQKALKTLGHQASVRGGTQCVLKVALAILLCGKRNITQLGSCLGWKILPFMININISVKCIAFYGLLAFSVCFWVLSDVTW